MFNPSEHIVDCFRREGAAPLRGLLSANDIGALRRGVDLVLEQPSERAKLASAPGDPGLFFEDFCNWRRIPAFTRFIEEGPLARVAAKLMDSPEARFHHDHVLIKEGGTTTRTPWHQDQPYYNIDGAQTVSFWLPLDPVSRESSLEFLAGSHLGPWLMPRSFADAQARWFPEGSLGELPDIEADRQAFPILGWALEPGDAVAFHMLTLHAASGSPVRRRVFSARFVGADVTHAPRPWTTSPEFPGLADELPAGAPLDHPLFPRLWPLAG